MAPSAPEAPLKQKEALPLDASLNKKWAACVLASGDVMQVVCSEVLLRFSIIRSHFSFFLHHKSTQTVSRVLWNAIKVRMKLPEHWLKVAFMTWSYLLSLLQVHKSRTVFHPEAEIIRARKQRLVNMCSPSEHQF